MLDTRILCVPIDWLTHSGRSSRRSSGCVWSTSRPLSRPRRKPSRTPRSWPNCDSSGTTPASSPQRRQERAAYESDRVAARSGLLCSSRRGSFFKQKTWLANSGGCFWISCTSSRAGISHADRMLRHLDSGSLTAFVALMTPRFPGLAGILRTSSEGYGQRLGKNMYLFNVLWHKIYMNSSLTYCLNPPAQSLCGMLENSCKRRNVS